MLQPKAGENRVDFLHRFTSDGGAKKKWTNYKVRLHAGERAWDESRGGDARPTAQPMKVRTSDSKTSKKKASKKKAGKKKASKRGRKK